MTVNLIDRSLKTYANFESFIHNDLASRWRDIAQNVITIRIFLTFAVHAKNEATEMPIEGVEDTTVKKFLENFPKEGAGHLITTMIYGSSLERPCWGGGGPRGLSCWVCLWGGQPTRLCCSCPPHQMELRCLNVMQKKKPRVSKILLRKRARVMPSNHTLYAFSPATAVWPLGVGRPWGSRSSWWFSLPPL